MARRTWIFLAITTLLVIALLAEWARIQTLERQIAQFDALIQPPGPWVPHRNHDGPRPPDDPARAPASGMFYERTDASTKSLR